MQKAEHDRRKFYQDENNEGYPPQSGHHLQQQPQAYHHSPYHQHPLRNNNQVHIFFIQLCINFLRSNAQGHNQDLNMPSKNMKF